ncbi:hypothetical protein AAVH_09775 [Aphelenchoides avenae]|nr:hypothetical protein AAVH_09775 [Aphelenchus avenae]
MSADQLDIMGRNYSSDCLIDQHDVSISSPPRTTSTRSPGCPLTKQHRQSRILPAAIIFVLSNLFTELWIYTHTVYASASIDLTTRLLLHFATLLDVVHCVILFIFYLWVPCQYVHVIDKARNAVIALHTTPIWISTLLSIMAFFSHGSNIYHGTLYVIGRIYGLYYLFCLLLVFPLLYVGTPRFLRKTEPHDTGHYCPVVPLKQEKEKQR